MENPIELKYLGEVSNKLISILKIANPHEINTYQKYIHDEIINEIGKLIKNKRFISKGKIVALSKEEDLKIILNEEHLKGEIKSCKRPGNNIISDKCNDESGIYALSMDQIKEFPLFKGNYIILPTLRTYTCDKEISCNSCNGNGKCKKCSGMGFYTCDDCDGSTECQSCHGTGKYPCYSCNQTGRCRNCDGYGMVACAECDGDGNVDCSSCDGDGYYEQGIDCYECNGSGEYQLRNGNYVTCRACHGRGIHHYERYTCWTCGGSGEETCESCNGSGEETCTVCQGDGICKKCNGDGNVDCISCNTTGKCKKCNGKGKLKCKLCNTSGICSTCEGKGIIKCPKCMGSGFYQTFSTVNFKEYIKTIFLEDKKFLFVKENEIKRNEIFNDPQIFKIDISKVILNEEKFLSTINRFENIKNLYFEYKKNYINLMNRPISQELGQLIVGAKIESTPSLSVEINYSGKNYKFFIVGTNGLVYYIELPNFWNNIIAIFK